MFSKNEIAIDNSLSFISWETFMNSLIRRKFYNLGIRLYKTVYCRKQNN